jgi:hypothetical protein
LEDHEFYLKQAKMLARRSLYFNSIIELDFRVVFMAMHHSLEFKADGGIKVSLETESPNAEIRIDISPGIEKEQLKALLALLQHKVELEFDEWKSKSEK